MNRARTYQDARGQQMDLADLDQEEHKLLAQVRRRFRVESEWNSFDNFWTRSVVAFYKERGLSRAEIRQTQVYRVAQDLSGRMAVAAGLARQPDYRDDLALLIRQKFASRRAFCKATGLAEDMLSHVLAGRKDLSLAALTKALDRIGYTLSIAPAKRRQTG